MILLEGMRMKNIEMCREDFSSKEHLKDRYFFTESITANLFEENAINSTKSQS